MIISQSSGLFSKEGLARNNIDISDTKPIISLRGVYLTSLSIATFFICSSKLFQKQQGGQLQISQPGIMEGESGISAGEPDRPTGHLKQEGSCYKLIGMPRGWVLSASR
jgi:hypothetical protein